MKVSFTDIIESLDSLTIVELRAVALRTSTLCLTVTSYAKECLGNKTILPLSDYEKDLIDHCRWVEAVKSYRSRTGCELLRAKDMVSEYKATKEK